MKICSVCKTEKEISCFNKCSSAKSGYSPRCKTCHNEMNEKYDRVLTAEQIARQRAYRKTYTVDPNKRKEAINKWNANNKESRKAYNAKWKKNNASRVLASTRKRQTMLINACPVWADHERINAFYAAADF